MTANPSPFVSTPSLQGLLQQLSHLSQFGANALVVEGDAGAGKTSLLEQHFFEQGATEHREISLLLTKFYVSKDAPQFTALRELGAGFGIDAAGLSSGEIISRLRSFEQALLREKQLAIALIDDAHELSQEELGALLSLLQQDGDATFGLKLIFFAESGFASRLDGMGLIDLAIYDFQLPPFSAQEIENLMREVLPVYQEERHTRANLPSYTALWSRSRGNPGKALSLAEEALSEGESKTLRDDILKMPVLHLVVVTVLLASLLLLFLYGGDGDDKPQRNTQEIVLAPESNVSSSNNTSEAVETALPRTIIAPSSDGVEEKKSSSSDRRDIAYDLNAADQVSDSAEPSYGKDVAALDDQGAVFSEEALPAVDLAPEVKQKSTVEEQTKTKASQNDPLLQTETSNLSRDERTLLDAGSSSYVLQLLAATKRDALDDFIKQQPNKDSMRVYRKKRDTNATWHVVVVGPFSSKSQAQSAISNLPADQRKAGPWLRNLGAVQKEIRDFHGL